MKWGFIGFGRIARNFLESLESVEDEVPYAFASRSSAKQLQTEFPNIKVYDSYEALLADSDIDIVYISTTHNFHCENTIAALKAGKHVVCEKPMGISSEEVNRMVETARSTGKFLMEAMWMRFLPAYREALKRAKSGEIGKVKYATASFGFRSIDKLTKDGRLLNPDLAGGALFDVGVYPLTLATDLFGWQPRSFKADALLSLTGVDESIQIQLDFGNNQMAQLFASISLETNKEACIYGENGYIRMPLFWKGQAFEVIKGDQIEKVEMPYLSNGYAHEIMEARDCIKKGQIESNIFNFNDSIQSAQLVEQILKSVFKPE